ncbi:hypothetical protein [Mesorhizobium sp. YR577]|uniref:hypothetical protein n=1 Tax=Mesorhizobium sp. YR577 TaxID=1884373 RepID=UPI0008E3D0E5|nr:hypothetical protein [Mesorhizobium sp. YR577]SFU21039.1 hypothetical protein SAMN05518861_12546 [Mesorhizobium sp. YR577]
MITRRLLLRNTVAATAVVATAAAPVAAETAQQNNPAMDHWAAFIASLGERAPAGSRIQIFGGAKHVRAEIMVTSIEQVHPKVAMPVERIVASYRLRPEGWVSEDRP